MALMDSVSENAIIQFDSEFHVRCQQKIAKLEPHCKLKQMKGKAMAYDGLGTVELDELDARFAEVEFGDMEHFRRKIVKQRFAKTLPIDKTDLEERLTNPESGYAEALAMAAKRQFDRVVYAAMFADVATGEDFENTVTFAGEGGLTVDATGGLTYEKLLEIIQNFIDGDVPIDDLQVVLGITGDEHTDLMSELELVSGDYSRQFVVDKAKSIMQMAAGIKLVTFAANGAGGADPILDVTAGTRTSFAMATGAICVGIARSWSIKVVERDDLYDTTQIQITGVIGAVRTEAKLIQKVTTTD